MLCYCTITVVSTSVLAPEKLNENQKTPALSGLDAYAHTHYSLGIPRLYVTVQVEVVAATRTIQLTGTTQHMPTRARHTTRRLTRCGERTTTHIACQSAKANTRTQENAHT